MELDMIDGSQKTFTLTLLEVDEPLVVVDACNPACVINKSAGTTVMV